MTAPSSSGGPDGATRGLASKRVAKAVADELRRRIIDGELADGQSLPKQEQLQAEFGVSQPTIREALGTLEAAGLLSVRRGRLGGAVVHRPRVDNAAYVIEQVLRSGKVPIEDVGEALRQLEPVSAALCALRPDRHETVVPRLREIHERSIHYVDDIPTFTAILRSFHEQLVMGCGNQTVILIVGALEQIWTAHASIWADERLREGQFPDRDYRLRALDDHDLFIRLIERGDAEAAARVAREHFAETPIYRVDGESDTVQLLVSLDRHDSP